MLDISLFKLSATITKWLTILGKQEGGWHKEEREHRRLEKSYWKKSIWLSFVITLGAVGSAVFTGLTVVEARKQAQVAEQTLTASTRAWLEIEEVPVFTSMSTREDSMHNEQNTLYVDVKLMNKGLSPALNIELSSRAIVDDIWSGNYPGDPASALNCSENEYAYKALVSGRVLFPNREMTQQIRLDTPIFLAKSVTDQDLPVALVICASYKIVGEAALHKSVSVFDIVDANNFEPATVGSKQKDFEKNLSPSLSLAPSEIGDYAN